MMGSPASEEGRRPLGPENFDCEKQHKVTITKGFYLGKYEVSQKEWRTVMGNNHSLFKGENLPVERVPWNDCQEFVRKLNEKEKRMYRLPTEAEWEYACRAGTNTAYYFGNDKEKLVDYAWCFINSGGKTHAVGQKKSNSWCLYDMH